MTYGYCNCDMGSAGYCDMYFQFQNYQTIYAIMLLAEDSLSDVSIILRRIDIDEITHETTCLSD